MPRPHTFDRRTFVTRTGTATAALALAGCLEFGEETDNGAELETAPEVIEVEDPPAAVYIPTHREAMRMLDPIEAGDIAIAPMLSYPHPFWIVAGSGEDAIERVEPEDGRGVHMMFTVWDRETGIVLPVDDGARVTVERDGEQVGSPLSPWTMISQEMGFHFGDNVSLPADGEYTVTVELPPISTTTTGALEDRLTDTETATFEFTYDEAFREEVVGGVEYFDESFWGTTGALEPMDHGDHGDHDDHDHQSGDDHHGDDHHDDGNHDGHGTADEHHESADGHGDHDDHGEHDDHDDHGEHHQHVPYSALARIGEYPGTILREPAAVDDGVPAENADLPRSGDAAVLVTVLESGSRLADGDEGYLLVSPRTPYNRVPLADMALSVTIERDGGETAELSLTQTIDGEYDLHYGASVEALEAGDSVTVTIDSPPQVARHQGYETAFLEMEDLEFVVPEVDGE
ncbi:hypothetical protein D8Y22_10310 [Salinadaptatus halalkaliphilus]|uniref:DUF7350 domain-containing protein n=1 Tax=Salinadaptatus halalkaliphilus TaxID=2419781 RepID=A0A4S3TLE9_9EURY|nr:hypothetical protein [Salinadaptatus halalkaliphilus]THE64994.1 hypothetical protein D8Y22_10310 [Salinadaptatus halalkaliphilus]